MGRKKICKDCGEELHTFTSGLLNQDGSVSLGEIVSGHRNLSVCKETLLKKKTSTRKKAK